MSGEYRIEPVSLARLDEHRAALDRVARERRWLLLLEAPPRERVEAFVRQNIEKGNAQFIAIEAAANQVVGWCDVTPRDRPTVEHIGALGMGVVAEHRGRGVGRRLLESTLAAAMAKGLHRIELEVWASNAAAIRLYESFGFEHEGLRRMARLVDGRAEDCLMMAIVR